MTRPGLPSYRRAKGGRTAAGARGITVVDRCADVTVPVQGTATVDVEVGSGLVDSVDPCEVDC
ncbi:hypothetical protein [Streptomyces sp. NPDC002788]